MESVRSASTSAAFRSVSAAFRQPDAPNVSFRPTSTSNDGGDSKISSAGSGASETASDKRYEFAVHPGTLSNEELLKYKYHPPYGGWTSGKLKELLRPAALERRIKFPMVKNPKKSEYIDALLDFDRSSGRTFEQLVNSRWSKNCDTRMLEVICVPRIMLLFCARNRAQTREEKDRKEPKPWDQAFRAISTLFNDKSFQPRNRYSEHSFLKDLDPSEQWCIPRTQAELSKKWKEIEKKWEDVHGKYISSDNEMDFADFAMSKHPSSGAIIYLHKIREDHTDLINSIRPNIPEVIFLENGDGDTNAGLSRKRNIGDIVEQGKKKTRGRQKRPSVSSPSASAIQDPIRAAYEEKIKAEWAKIQAELAKMRSDLAKSRAERDAHKLDLMQKLESSIEKYEKELADAAEKGLENEAPYERKRKTLKVLKAKLNRVLAQIGSDE